VLLREPHCVAVSLGAAVVHYGFLDFVLGLELPAEMEGRRGVLALRHHLQRAVNVALEAKKSDYRKVVTYEAEIAKCRITTIGSEQ
jgi:hypothetical protein